ncbi:solute carrier family 35 member F1-like [Herrania umbratica]|uniref:Solute carrier family 35 member F1-like n=1 Tax=Herrania umbratica TaxID=108875 RepID=A0A6J1AWE5_9ROSI|nr:solute carrier family 35 member F1-like [Herrania umbratica]XP_021291260.1 solute carrier family 35 member F1-like [Herrania umbratica]
MMSVKQFWTKKTLVGLGLGQFLSLLITSTGFSSSELAKKGINAPTSQSFLNYVLLTVVYGSVMLYRRQALKAKWYYYVVLGLVDVEANYLVVKAYQYTSITSVMLLDCWSIPSVMLLTFLFLKTKYRFRKIAGVIVCVAGLVMVVFSDVHAGDRSGGSNPRKGDLFVIAGATLYAISNVSEEFLVKNADRVELMSFLGLFGAIISSIQISIIERNELKSIRWTAGAAFPFFGFSLAMFLFYSFVPVLLKMSGSTMLNLSLLTSDMWAVLIRIFAYHEKVDWMYFLAFVAVAVGLIIYSGGDKEEDQRRTGVADEDADTSKHFDQEAGFDNLNRGTMAGSSKTGETSTPDCTTSTGAREIISNKNVGKDTRGKKS